MPACIPSLIRQGENRPVLWRPHRWLWVVFGVLAPALLLPQTGLSQHVISDEHLDFFEKKVRPLLVLHCYECHSGEESNGGLRLDSRDGLIRGGDSGTSLVPGEPDESLLIEAVRYQNEDLRMPPDGRLQPAEIATLVRWIKTGAADPRSATDRVGASPMGMSLEDGRKFWSFRPVANPTPPDMSDSQWTQNPIDAFVLSRLTSMGIQPAMPADRRTMIRRVTFDLIGLPPTPEQIDAFVANSSPGAFNQLVDRLLASPQYGERWGRHWLDVARYADSNGLDENLAFGSAWRYRDYVVDAFNDDKPFDRFLTEQIAGDLLPGANRETKIATGFLALGAKVLAEPDREKLAMDTIDEQLDAMGKTFLGMTFGCVRCHDHKFDPIKQRDYYALAAILKSTRTFGETKQGAIKHWYEHSFATPQQIEIIKKADAEIAAKKKAATTFKNSTIAALRTAARSRAADYLVAAAKFDTSASLNEVAEIAKPMGLHPRILHHCRLHLDYHQDDELFSKWHQLVSEKSEASVQAVAAHYGVLFAKVESAWADAQKASPTITKLDDKTLESARKALNDPSGFLAVPPKPEFAFDKHQLVKYHELMEQARLTESSAPDADSAMGVTEAPTLTSLPIHIRGSHRNFGGLVQREFPQVMRTSSARPIFPSNQSGRLQLARWMANTQHPLTARVYVNRVWAWHFGRGIVGSTENFGRLGDQPSHPNLLDWLARYFMQTGWSTKNLHRLILSSSTYQMSSRCDSLLPNSTSGETVDPENRLLWRFPLRRLDAEQIRDSILEISGRLDESRGGKTIPLRNRQFVFNHTSVDHTKYDSQRRAIYLPVIRNNIYSLFAQFDFPDPTMPTGTRATTVVAPQALIMMNSDLIIDSANALATIVLDQANIGPDRIDLAYRKALGRPSTKSERSRALSFIDSMTSRAMTGSASLDPKEEHRAWSLFCQSLFASNEFVYVR